MSKEEELYLSIGRSMPEAELSKMFGKPSLKVGSKAFACFFQNCMVFKLGNEEHKEAISLPGSVMFDPSGAGRPMKEWVQVPFEFHDRWKSYAQAAMDYVKKGGK